MEALEGQVPKKKYFDPCSVSGMTILLFKLANSQIRHQASHKICYQPGVCIWSLQYSSGVWVGIYELTY